jgi:hypothetical protein
VGSKLQVQKVGMMEETRRGGRRGAKVADMTWVGHDGAWGHMVAHACRVGCPIFFFVCTSLMG